MPENLTEKKTVSVALCTYNGANFIAEQLDSILNQDYHLLEEIICVDDNSSDATWDILSGYAAKDSRFKLFRNTINLGYVQNFEKAISLSSSGYIAISDQDDIWYPTKISDLITGIGDHLMVYSDNKFIDSSGNDMGILFSNKRNLTQTTSCLNFALFNAISGHTILFKRELKDIILPFPPNVHYDWWMGFCAAQYDSIQYVHKPLVGYRQHESNIVGGYGVQKLKHKKKNRDRNEDITRLNCFAAGINTSLTGEKAVIDYLIYSYLVRTVKTRMKRVLLFLKYRDELLLFKKRSPIRKFIYCFKTFWKYD